MKTKYLLLIGILIILSTQAIYPSFKNPFNRKNSSNWSFNKELYYKHQVQPSSIKIENHTPLVIFGNTKFSDQATQEGWFGNGTVLNPYHINGFKFTGFKSEDLIQIINTDLYFQISNCILNGGKRGILLWNVKNGLIINNTFLNNNGSALNLGYSSQNAIINNTFFNNSNGIRLESSSNNNIEKNTINTSIRPGITLSLSFNIAIANNSINGNDHGIYCSASLFNTISENNISNNRNSGLYLDSSENNTIINNTLDHNSKQGIFQNSSSHSIILGNTINNQAYGIYLDESDSSTIEDNTISESTRSAIYLNSSDDIYIDNNVITKNSESGISMFFSDNNTAINNIITNNGLNGIQLYSSNRSTIINNIFSYNNRSGIHLEFSNTSSINNNTISYNDNGIYLSISFGSTILDNVVYINKYGFHLYSSRNNIISKNFIFNNIEYGIYLSSSGNNTVSDNYLIDDGLFMSGSQLGHFLQTAVINNLVNGKPLVYWDNLTNDTVPSGAGQVVLVNCTSVTVTGEDLVRTSVGVFTAYCSNLTIYNNVLSLNNQFGIYLFTSANCTISNNTFFNNYNSGIHLDFSDFTTIINNTIHHNSNNGVFISASNSSTIVSNSISNNKNGILLSSSCSGNISNNIIFTNDIGIGLHNSANNTIEGNKLTDNSLSVFGDESSYYIQEKVSDNTINGKTLIYWCNVSDSIVPEETAQVILINCTNVKVIGLNLTNVNIGILAIQSMNLTIQENIISDNHEGIRFVDLINSSIIRNIIIYNRFNGIFLQSSHMNTITENIISYNDFSGLVLVKSNSSIISRNFIVSNGINGIEMWICNGNNISNNRISNNNEYGIYLNLSRMNQVRWNSFLGNNPDGVSQAYANQFNIFRRNYWDDWTNPDVDADGIVDYNYTIYGSSYIDDLFPSTVPYLIESFSLSKPTVLFPNGRENLGGIITIQWSVSSGFLSHGVIYDVYYSIDNGISWTMLAAGLTTTYYIWNTTTLPDGSTYRIKIIAFDSEGVMSLDISNSSFTINNSYSGMTLLKLLILLNTAIICIFIFIISFSALREIYFRYKNESLSKDSVVEVLKNDFMNFVNKGKWVILAVCIAFILSFMRAWLIDPAVVVDDRYDWYAINMKWLLIDWTHEIDRIPMTMHQFRIIYPLLIAILSTISTIDVILIGRLISMISFSVSIYYLSKILDRFKTLSQSPNKERILIVFIMTPTMITNFVRLETDILFLALSLYIIHQYMMFISGELNNPQKVNLFLAIGLLIFTREVGIVLILALILHKFLTISPKYMLLTGIISSILLLVSLRIEILQDLLFTAIWNATSYKPAYEIVYNNNLLILVEIFMEKVSDPNDINTTLESLVLAFFPAIIFCFLGFLRLYRTKNMVNRKRILINIITLYFLTYFTFFILFKVGRGVDRFWIPVLLFPLLLLPFTLDIEELIRDTQKLINEIFKWIYYKIFRREKKSYIASSYFNMIKNALNLNDKSVSIFPRSTFYFIVNMQILFYVVRLILSLIVAGILPVYQ